MIANVSDTALWVALDRAIESDRPDALFRDTHARRLAGARGEAIVRELGAGGAAVRTAVFDEMIAAAVVAAGVEMVINLAAGLDTRPWRLGLPPTLRWVDVDLPAILAHKTDCMAGEPPRCRYEAIPVDLTDAEVRRALLRRLGTEATTILVVTEGLLVYLTSEVAADLARELCGQPSIRWWLCDIWSPEQLRNVRRAQKSRGFARLFRFAPTNGPDFFRSFGWAIALYRVPLLEAQRLKREQPRCAWLLRLVEHLMGSNFRATCRRAAFRASGSFVLLERVPPHGQQSR